MNNKTVLKVVSYLSLVEWEDGSRFPRPDAILREWPS